MRLVQQRHQPPNHRSPAVCQMDRPQLGHRRIQSPRHAVLSSNPQELIAHPDAY
jgi:hypothetical protein